MRPISVSAYANKTVYLRHNDPAILFVLFFYVAFLLWHDQIPTPFYVISHDVFEEIGQSARTENMYILFDTALESSNDESALHSSCLQYAGIVDDTNEHVNCSFRIY